ncbi:Uncharacterised protein [Mycobacteroides abscessus subsp. abscessus]|nr:Uncharacterised protein [Mycobacteroides abscessus subsp. abscessus]
MQRTFPYNNAATCWIAHGESPLEKTCLPVLAKTRSFDRRMPLRCDPIPPEFSMTTDR